MFFAVSLVLGCALSTIDQGASSPTQKGDQEFGWEPSPATRRALSERSAKRFFDQARDALDQEQMEFGSFTAELPKATGDLTESILPELKRIADDSEELFKLSTELRETQLDFLSIRTLFKESIWKKVQENSKLILERCTAQHEARAKHRSSAQLLEFAEQQLLDVSEGYKGDKQRLEDSAQLLNSSKESWRNADSKYRTLLSQTLVGIRELRSESISKENLTGRKEDIFIGKVTEFTVTMIVLFSGIWILDHR